MSQESLEKMRQTNIEKYGSYEAYKAEMKRRAIKGGQTGRGPGFKDKDLARRAGKLGGIAKAKRGVHHEQH